MLLLSAGLFTCSPLHPQCQAAGHIVGVQYRQVIRLAAYGEMDVDLLWVRTLDSLREENW